MKCLIRYLILILVVLTAVAGSAAELAAKKLPPPLRVVGNRLKAPDGSTVRWQGVNIASLEWSSQGENVLKSFNEAIDRWGCNCIRLPLSQDRWFGRAKDQKDNGVAYRQLVRDCVDLAAGKGCYVILDLHWSNAGQWGKHIGQHHMPDDHSVLFWQSAAIQYANHPAVVFDLYNEPHDVSWEVWRNGGTVTEKIGGATTNYHTPGMQKLLDTCRAQGARNIVVAGGLDWAYDLSGILKGHALSDPKGNGVVYATHIYPWKGNWEKHVGVVTTNYCVLVGEVGCEHKEKSEDPATTWAPKVLAFIEQHQLNWTAWCFHPSAGPCMIKDWNYTPTPYWGVYAQKALLEGAARRAASNRGKK